MDLISGEGVFQLMNDEGLSHIKWDCTPRFDPQKVALWLEEQQQSA